MTQYFITENYLKSQGFINKNVDTLLYMNLVQGVAKSFLPSQLGKVFFNHLLTAYNNQTLNSDEEDLVAMMQYAISNRLISEVAISTTFQITNKGIQVQNSDNSTGVDIKTVGVVMDNYLQKATGYELEIKSFLCENKDLFPEFTSPLNKNSSIKNHCCTTYPDWLLSGCGCRPDNYNQATGILII